MATYTDEDWPLPLPSPQGMELGERSQTEEEYIAFGDETPEDSSYDPSYDNDSDSDCVEGYTDFLPL